MTGKERLSRELMAMRVAGELEDGEDGMVVNLGIGMPTLVGNYISTDGGIILHAENGVIGFGPFPQEGQENPNLVNAGGQPVTLLPGAAIISHADSFAMIRGGYIDVAVLGGFQVSQRGDLANWSTDAGGLGSPGGAVDLALAARRVIVMMEHATKDGQPKLLRECSYPLTGKECVELVVTDLGLFQVTGEGLLLREIAPGWTIEEVQALTDAPLTVSPELREFLG
jgi:3-oxoacid CoA-transferase subunit B